MIYTLVVVAAFSGTTVEAETEVETVTDRVERIAREYRMSVYDAYHSDRDKFDQRYKLSSRLQSAWVEAGRPTEFADRMIDWYQLSNNADSLPTAPNWIDELESDAAKNAALRERLTQTAKPFKLGPIITEEKPVAVPVAAPPAAIVERTVAEPASDKPAPSLLDSLGRSILRATINSTEPTDANGFE